MKIRYLGWAGVEVRVGESAVVIDPLEDAAAVFSALGERAEGAVLPAVVAPSEHLAVAGMVTHLHRDHADAGALRAALRPDAPVLGPQQAGGEALEDIALAQAEYELSEAGLRRRRVEPWQTIEIEPFTLTALPACDGTGDPQVSWLVEAGGVRVLHLGDTMFHGYWWRMALRHGPFDLVLAPVNGTVVDFPHRQPRSEIPIVLDPRQAATAAALLQAQMAIPIHADGYELDGLYEPQPDSARTFLREAGRLEVAARMLDLGEVLQIDRA